MCVKLSLLLDSVFAIGFCCGLLSLQSFAELIVLAEIVWLGRESSDHRRIVRIFFSDAPTPLNTQIRFSLTDI